jgi:hypothetical protein
MTEEDAEIVQFKTSGDVDRFLNIKNNIKRRIGDAIFLDDVLAPKVLPHHLNYSLIPGVVSSKKTERYLLRYMGFWF